MTDIYKLTYGQTTETLPQDLLWIDEYGDWTPVAQAKGRSLTGSLILDLAAKTKGRPITLQGDATSAWMSRALVKRLIVWRDTPGAEMTLVANGASHTVIFDQERGGFVADLVVPFSDPASTDWYVPRLYFLTV